MNTKNDTCDRDVACRSNRREFNVRLATLLMAVSALPLGSGSISDRGRWILNERDR